MSYIRIQNTSVTIGPFEDPTIPCEEMMAIEYPVKDCRKTCEYGNSSAILLSCSANKECMFKTVDDFVKKYYCAFSRNFPPPPSGHGWCEQRGEEEHRHWVST